MSEQYSITGQTQKGSLRANLTMELNRRTRAEAFCDVLQALGTGGGKPTHIVHKTNLPLPVVQSYVKAFEQQGLVSTARTEGKGAYQLTKKGYKMLDRFFVVAGTTSE